MTVRRATDRLDAGAIADAAIAIADAEGAAAVSMRRVGAALGVSGMALYRHVGDREDLVRRMVARVADELPHVPAYEAGWRETLHHLATTEWTAFERHRWLVDVAVSPSGLVDATSAPETETVLARLVAAGCSPRRAGDLFLGTAALVIGIARVALGPSSEASVGPTSGRTPDTAPSRPVEYAADDAGGRAPAADTLTARFRSEPFDAARGRRLLEAVLGSYLDGVAASLHQRDR